MRFELPGRTGEAAALAPASGALIVSSAYFRVLGIPLVRGRVFTAAEDGGGQAGDPALATEAVRGALRAANPLQPVAEIRPMRSAMSEAVAQPRFLTVLVGLFGAVAVVLAALGLYGVVSYAVARRTPEIGVRMALGAHPRDVVLTVVGHAAAPALLGMGEGLGGAWVLSRLLSGLLFEVRPADPAAYAAAAATLAAVALVASWLPARRAARIPPTAALRAD